VLKKESDSALILNSSLNEVFIGIASFACACVSFWLTRAPNGIALLWPGNAIAAALLIRLPKVRWGVALIALLFAGFCANMLVAHRPWGIAAALTGINGIEIALMVATFRFALRFPYPDLSIGQAAIMTGLFGIVIPGIAAAIAGILLHARFQTSFAQGTLHWWSSHAIGACLISDKS
jgi:integral membrane sensor domain MASE1